MVSDWSLGNNDLFQLKALDRNQVFLPGVRGNCIMKELRTTEHSQFLAEHTMKIIDHLTCTYPNIKLIFWCLYTRTKHYKIHI